MVLQLGDRRIDLARQVLVLAVLDARPADLDGLCAAAVQAVVHGAGAVALPAAALDDVETVVVAVGAASGVPVIVDTAAAAVVARALAAGAAGFHDPIGAASNEALAAAAAARAVAIVPASLVDAAAAAGLETGRVVVDIGASPVSVAGHPMLASLPDAEVHRRPGGAVAGHAVAVARGCRILRAADVRAARRTAAVIDAVLAARGEASWS